MDTPFRVTIEYLHQVAALLAPDAARGWGASVTLAVTDDELDALPPDALQQDGGPGTPTPCGSYISRSRMLIVDGVRCHLHVWRDQGDPRGDGISLNRNPDDGPLLCGAPLRNGGRCLRFPADVAGTGTDPLRCNQHAGIRPDKTQHE